MKNVKRTNKWLIVILVVGAILLNFVLPIGLGIYMFFETNITYDFVNNDVIINDGDLKVTNLSGYYDLENKVYIIEGVLKNNSDEYYDYVDISFYVYDENGNVLGESSDNLTRLEKGASWKFKAKYYENDAKDIEAFKFLAIDLL